LPISAIQQDNGHVNAPDGLSDSEEHFALEVQGDSMIDAGILEGDIVICCRTESASTGDIVVALIDGEEATLKRFAAKGLPWRLKQPTRPMRRVYSALTVSQYRGVWWRLSAATTRGTLARIASRILVRSEL
jgi:SOS-response transcriptional repressor LexA